MGNVCCAVRAARLKQPDVDTAFAAIAVPTSLGFLSRSGIGKIIIG
jgi:hypothetical protein